MRRRTAVEAATWTQLLASLALLMTRKDDSDPRLILAFVFLASALVTSCFIDPKPFIDREGWRRHLDLVFGIRDRSKTWPQVLKVCAWLAGFLAAMVWCLRVLERFPLLDDRKYIALPITIIVFFLVSYAVPFARDLDEYGRPIGVVLRLGIGFWAASVAFCVALAANGYPDRTIVVRNVTCLGKRASHDPQAGNQYLRARPWGDSDHEVDLSVSSAIYERAATGSRIRLVTGDGRLGLEWIRAVQLEP